LPPGAVGLDKDARDREIGGVRLPISIVESSAEDDEVVAAGDGADAVEVLGRHAVEDRLH
jgi:hypothetical protein